MLTVSEEIYQLKYSARYNSIVHHEATIKRYDYCVGLKRAFESSILEEYISFIFTIACITVAIVYSPDDGRFKVFDSHARYFYGESYPQGTFVLLDIS